MTGEHDNPETSWWPDSFERPCEIPDVLGDALRLVWVSDKPGLWWLYRLNAEAFTSRCRVIVAALDIVECLGWLEHTSDQEWFWLAEDPAIHFEIGEGREASARLARNIMRSVLQDHGLCWNTRSTPVLRAVTNEELRDASQTLARLHGQT